MFGLNSEAKNNAALCQGAQPVARDYRVRPERNLSANANFCRMLGYAPEEIVGKHHSIFVDPDYARSAEYREFWASSAAANTTRVSTSGSARAASRSGSKPPTTPC